AAIPQDPEPVDRSEAFGQQPQQPAPDASFGAEQARPMPPPYGLPAQLTLKPGTFVTVRINQALSSDPNQPGDIFSAVLIQPVVVDGVVVAQHGQTVYGRVAETKRASSSSPSRLGLELTGLTLVDGTQAPIRSQLVSRQGGTTPTGDQIGTV